MAFLAKMKYGARHLQHGHGAGHFLVDKGERYAASAAFGFLKGYYREKTMIGGKVPLDLLVGGLSTAAAAVLSISSGGRSKLVSHLNAIGDSGVTSYFNSLGAAMGAKYSGRQVLVLNAGATAPASLPAGYSKDDVLGAIPQAVGGAYLTAEEIAHYSAQR